MCEDVFHKIFQGLTHTRGLDPMTTAVPRTKLLPVSYSFLYKNQVKETIQVI